MIFSRHLVMPFTRWLNLVIGIHSCLVLAPIMTLEDVPVASHAGASTASMSYPFCHFPREDGEKQEIVLVQILRSGFKGGKGRCLGKEQYTTKTCLQASSEGPSVGSVLAESPDL